MSNKDELTIFVSRRGFLGTGMGMAGLAALAACGGNTSSGTVSSYGIPKATQAFVHARPTDVISLDPANTLGDSDQEISHNIYERLLAPKWDSENSAGELIWDGLAGAPQLATSWEVNGPVITFHLRTDVKFYPTGNPLTGEDVRYSFERLTKIVGNGQFQAGVAASTTPARSRSSTRTPCRSRSPTRRGSRRPFPWTWPPCASSSSRSSTRSKSRST